MQRLLDPSGKIYPMLLIASATDMYTTNLNAYDLADLKMMNKVIMDKLPSKDKELAIIKTISIESPLPEPIIN